MDKAEVDTMDNTEVEKPRHRRNTCCGFCGNTNRGELNFNCTVGGNIGYFIFCKNSDCYDLYHNYVYSKNISKGLPFLEKQYFTNIFTSSPELSHCYYCNLKNENVEIVPSALIARPAQSKFADLLIKHQYLLFCRNHHCLKRFNDYLTTNIPKIPAFIKRELNCVCEPAQQHCTCDAHTRRNWVCEC
jgi:hypothetical protein